MEMGDDGIACPLQFRDVEEKPRSVSAAGAIDATKPHGLALLTEGKAGSRAALGCGELVDPARHFNPFIASGLHVQKPFL